MKTIRQILICIMAGSVCYACHVEPKEKQPTVETVKKEYLKRESIFIDAVIHPARMAIGNNQLYIYPVFPVIPWCIPILYLI